MTIKAISLFSGMGGDTLGMKMAGVDVVAYSEKEVLFRKSHDLNFPQCQLIPDGSGGSDITKIQDEQFEKFADTIDLVFAGFPCQGFSNAGKKDINDVRNTLFKEFLRAVRIIKPTFFIGENVKGLLSRKDKDGNNYIDVIVSEFEKVGYDVKYKVFKTENYGIPQKRERLLIIGVKRNMSTVEFPDEHSAKTNLIDIVKFDMTGSFRVSENIFKDIPAECILSNMDNDQDGNNPHPYLVLKATSTNETYSGKTHASLLSFKKRDSPIHCEIIDIRNPCKTIICTYSHQPRLFVPLKNKRGCYLRCLLPDELKQIQTFPADYKIAGPDSKKIIQIGNAVPPSLIQQVVDKLLEMF
ncbi:MAG: DNA cytosine methyltransferase [Sphingobacteriia bacterium]|nr:DNA cytosine methyltransferase [Sphingobacteriia bacterium]